MGCNAALPSFVHATAWQFGGVAILKCRLRCVGFVILGKISHYTLRTHSGCTLEILWAATCIGFALFACVSRGPVLVLQYIAIRSYVDQFVAAIDRIRTEVRQLDRKSVV